VPTNDDFTPHDHLPVFFSGHPENGRRDSSRLFKPAILAFTATLIGIAIAFSLGNPLRLFADTGASLTDTSAPQPDIVQSIPTVQPTADTQALPLTATGAPSRNETTATFEATYQGPADMGEAPTGALLKQFQAWATQEEVRPQEDAPPQIEPARPAQEARAQALQSEETSVRPIHKHRRVRPIQNARAEMPLRNPRARIRRDQNARVAGRPVQDAQAQDQSVQNALAPTFLQSLGRQQ